MTGNLRDLTGQDVAHYRIVRRLGGGAMAGVYEATDQILDKTVALKVLLMGADDLTRKRFRQEARMGSSLVHPHVVHTLQVGQTSADGIAYIAMELVEGLTLSELLDLHRTLPIPDASNLLEPIARALEFAHDKGIVHRDVKPSNILLRYVEHGSPNSTELSVLGKSVVPLLSDFGISRALDSPELTSAGRTIGTPSYMAPEQCAGSREVDGRADIYSLGTVLYRCLVGRAPYVGTTTQILHAHVYEPLTIPDDILDELPGSIVGALKNSLMKEPENRYQNVKAMAGELALTISAERASTSGDESESGVKVRADLLPAVSSAAKVEHVEHNEQLARDEEIISSVRGTESTSAVAVTTPRKAASISRVPTKPSIPIKLGTSTTNPRVTRPLPPSPLPVARKQRNWAGLVIGGALMLVILFAGLATVRSLWPTGNGTDATTTTAITEGGASEGSAIEPSGDKQADENVVEPIENGESSAENEADSSAGDSSAGDSSIEKLTGDEPTVLNTAEKTTGNSEVVNSEAENSEAENSKDESESSAEASAETISLWDDVQYFHERRDWYDALDSLILMQRSDASYQPQQSEMIGFNIYMGSAALQMQELLQLDVSNNDDTVGEQVINKQQLETVANYYDRALDVQSDSAAAKYLLAATDKFAESVPSSGVLFLDSDSIGSESTGSESKVAVATVDLQSAYADYSASLALKGNYCSAVEQLTVSVLLSYRTEQVEQLTSYLEECPDLKGILETVEEQRRARQLAKTPRAVAVSISTPVESTTVEATSESTSESVRANPPPTVTRPSPATATAPPPAPTVKAVAAVPVNFRGLLTGRILYSSVEQGKNVVWAVPAAPDSSSSQLIDLARQPTIHPNGQLVTYHSDLEFKEGIRGFDMAGGLPLPEGNFIQFIYHPEAAQFSPPTWSPNGETMLFGSTVDADRVSRIYSAQNNSAGNYLYVTHGREPDWHPFEDLVVYKGADETGNRPGLWLMSGGGGNKQRFSDNGGDSRPVWSTNGRDIVFMSSGRGANGGGNWDIFSANYETREITQLTTDSANDGLPTVSPDGKYVAFLSNRGGVWQIWALPITGGEPRAIAPIRGSLPNWLEQSIQWVR